MRWPWAASFVLGYALFLASEADASALYKFKGPLPFDRGQIELTFENDNVSGQLLPHPGAVGRAVRVSGTNPADGVLELTFHFDTPETATFKKSLEEDNIHWSSTNGRFGFWRPRYSDFSDAALTLDKSGDCGPI